MSRLTLTPPPDERVIWRRKRRGPNPRFLPDLSRQLDGAQDCPDAQVPDDHLARLVLVQVEKIEPRSSRLSPSTRHVGAKHIGMTFTFVGPPTDHDVEFPFPLDHPELLGEAFEQTIREELVEYLFKL